MTYKIKSLNDEDILRSFYEPWLVKFDKIDENIEVEKIIKTRTRNGKNEYFVKWKGYNSEFNSWVENLNY